MKLSRKAWFMIILKVIKNQGFTLSLENMFGKKQGCQIDPPAFKGLQFVLIVALNKQTYSGFILEKTNFFEDNIRNIMFYVVAV